MDSCLKPFSHLCPLKRKMADLALLLVGVLQGCEQNVALNNCHSHRVCYQASVAPNDKKMVNIVDKENKMVASS